MLKETVKSYMVMYAKNLLGVTVLLTLALAFGMATVSSPIAFVAYALVLPVVINLINLAGEILYVSISSLFVKKEEKDKVE